MAAVLPPLLLAALTCWRRSRGWRQALLDAVLLWAAWVVLLSEVLSAWGALRFWPVVFAWAAACAAAACAAAVALARRAPGAPPAPPPFGRDVRLLAAALVAVAALVGAVAILAPPNNWDSMVYHLPRVRHWLRQGDLGGFPSHSIKQLNQPPLVELLQLQLLLLAGGDHLLNLLQWCAYVACAAGVSLLAARLGAGRRGQLCAAVFCATLPMAILQASNTKNDLVVALLLLALSVRALDLARGEERGAAVWIGLAVGLMVLAKVTGAIFALPVLPLAGLLWWARRGAGAWRPLLLIAAIALLLNAGHFARLARLALAARGTAAETIAATSALVEGEAAPAAAAAPGSGLGGGLYVNRAVGIRPLASNLLRNAALHLAAPGDWLNRRLYNGIVAAHALAGADASDPRTTYPAWPYRVRGMSRHEDLAGNPLHLLLIGAAGALFLRRRERGRGEWIVLLLLLSGALLFSAILKWQPWHSRLHLPLFVVAAGFVGAQLERGLSRRACAAIAAALLLAALPWLLANQSRPLLGPDSVLRVPRAEQYFANRPELRAPYLNVVRRLRGRGCAAVGTVLNGDDWEYPLWALLDPSGAAGARIAPLDVQNASNAIPLAPDFAPCALVVSKDRYAASLHFRGVRFDEEWRSDKLRLFGKRN